jgi:hypothetical protein
VQKAKCTRVHAWLFRRIQSIEKRGQEKEYFLKRVFLERGMCERHKQERKRKQKACIYM